MNDFLGIEEIEYQMDKYFDKQDTLYLPYTIQGLALALDIDTSTLYKWGSSNYPMKGLSEEDNIRLVRTIKKAKLKVEEYSANALFKDKGQVTGIIFNLKNNFGWKDTQEIKTTNDSNVNLTGLSKEELRELIYQEEKESNE